MSTQSSTPSRVQRERKTYLLTDAMHRLETALSQDPDSPDYMEHVTHRLAHILGKLGDLWRDDRPIVIDKTRKCIESNSPNESVRSQLLESLGRSQAA